MQLTAKRGRKEVHPFLEISCRKRVVDTGLFRDEDSERAVQRGVFSVDPLLGMIHFINDKVRVPV